MDLIKCNRTDCFQIRKGKYCALLREPIQDCPFYKTVELAEEGRKWAHERLVQEGRDDLITMYEKNRYVVKGRKNGHNLLGL